MHHGLDQSPPLAGRCIRHMVTWYIAFGVDLLWPIAHRPVCRLGESSQQILNLVLPLSGETALSSAFVSRRN